MTRLIVASALAGSGIVVVLAGPSTAAPRPAADPAAGTAPTRCTAADIRVDAPTGDPYVRGVTSTVVWTLRFTNLSTTTCLLSGSPAVTATYGGTTTPRFGHVAGNDEFAIPSAPVTLRPGDRAGASVLDTVSATGCATSWRLAVTVGGAAHRVDMKRDMFGPCAAGAAPRVSPYFALSRLTKGLPAQAAQPKSTAPACAARDVHASLAGAQTGATTTVMAVRLTTTARASCAMAGAYPTILVGQGRAARVAKAGTALVPLARGALAPRTSAAAASPTALRAGHPVVVAVVLAATPAGTDTTACRDASALSFYPSGATTGQPVRIALASAVRTCGTPRVAPYLDGARTAAAAQRTTAALSRMRTSAARARQNDVSPLGDTSGFFYGTDSNAPTTTNQNSNNVWMEPAGNSGSAPGRYGWYGGEIGSYFHWKNCGGIWDGINFNSTNSARVNSNLLNHSVGVGTGAYWMMAGPGVDPNYDGTTAEARAFGQAQAVHVTSVLNSNATTYYNGTVYADVEDATRTGWNAVWSGNCGAWGGNEQQGYVPAALDLATFNGFWSYINTNTAYYGGMYCAGGSAGDTWSNIFGSNSYPASAGPEWTYVNETSSTSTFPSGWSVNGVNATFWGGVSRSDSGSGSQAGVWQWSGGNGTSNGYGDFDQIFTAGLAGYWV